MIKKQIIIPILFLFIGSIFAYWDMPINKVIYGEDDRVLVENSINSEFIEYAKSTAALISKETLTYSENGHFVSVDNVALINNINICEEVRFSNLPAISLCSGFLVGPDMLVTAAHCVLNNDHCKTRVSFVFDYRLDFIGNNNKIKFPSDNVYHCSKILERKNIPHLDVLADLAVIKLDRPVIGRTPLKYRIKGKINDNAPLVIIGHPSGLPTIIADNAHVRNNSYHYYFNANLDSFSCNSGSAVINKNTGLVEGILVRGDTDFIDDPIRKCKILNRCKDDGCTGEDVTRINAINILSPTGKAWVTKLPIEDEIIPSPYW